MHVKRCLARDGLSSGDSARACWTRTGALTGVERLLLRGRPSGGTSRDRVGTLTRRPGGACRGGPHAARGSGRLVHKPAPVGQRGRVATRTPAAGVGAGDDGPRRAAAPESPSLRRTDPKEAGKGAWRAKRLGPGAADRLSEVEGIGLHPLKNHAWPPSRQSITALVYYHGMHRVCIATAVDRRFGKFLLDFTEGLF
jgi:hypothetical protein